MANKEFDKLKFQIREIVKSIFSEIDYAIESTRSKYPVKIEESKFIKKYELIKQKYL